jgi:cholesterol transport system auxiliary component
MRSQLPSSVVAFVALAAILLCVGCSALTGSTPRKARYMLAVRHVPPAERAPRGAVLEVRTLSVAAPFADRSFVYRIGESAYETDYYSEFLAAPDRLITCEVMEWMVGSGLFNIVTDAYAGVDSQFALEGHVVELYGDYRPGREPRAIMQIQFMLIDVSGPRPSVVHFARYRREEPVTGTGPAGLVVGWNRALAQIMTELEAALGELHLNPGA